MSIADRSRRLIGFCLLPLLAAQLVWAAKPQISIPEAADYRPSGLLPGQTFTLLPDGRWLLLGGMTESGPSPEATIRDPKSGSSIRLHTNLVFARAWHSATLLPDGRVLVIGGDGTSGEIVNRAEILDYENQDSQVSPLLLTPRSHHTATLLTDGRVLVVGGVGSDGSVLKSAQLVDIRKQAVADGKAELSNGRQDQNALLLSNGTVLLFGGKDEFGLTPVYADLYEPDSDRFSSDSLSPQSNADHNVPTVEASLPADGAVDVEVGTLIAVRFSKPMNVQTISASSVILKGPAGGLGAKVVPTERGMLAFVTPGSPLEPGTTYTLSISGAQDRDGLALPYRELSFTTAGKSQQSKDRSANSSAAQGQIDAEQYPPRLAPPGVTAVSGQVLQLDHKPLARVTLQIGNLKTETDERGRFLLAHIPDGHQVMVIDGRSANVGNVSYGLYEDGVDITPKKTNVLGYKIWMTALDTGHAVTISSPTFGDTVVKTPIIPGLELHMPPGTVLYDHDGRVATSVSITSIPVDQPPFPLPAGVQVPLYFTIQPGGGYFQVNNAGPKGARLFYPNPSHFLPGTRFAFWNYDADQKGWYVYGQGSVSPDRAEVIPDPGVVIYELTGAMVGNPGPPPGSGPPPGGGPPRGGDPVDLSTGLFVLEHVDFSLPDIIPVVFRRTYRQGDMVSRDFGIGTTHNYGIYLTGDKFPWTYIDLILPDGGRIHYARISTDTTWTDAVYSHIATPTQFYGSTIVWNNQRGGWDLRFKDGSVWGFPEASNSTLPSQAAIQFIQDRFGNTVTMTRAPSTGLLNQITTSNGKWLAFTYDTCNRVTAIADNIGRTTLYAYDSTNCTTGHLHTVTDPNQGATTYTYNTSNADQMSTITDARNITYLQNVFDSTGRVRQQTLANGGTYTFSYTSDASGNIVQTDVTDPNGVVRRVAFSPPALFQTGFQTGGYVTSDTYALGKPEQQTFTYNMGLPANNPGNFAMSVTDPLGRVTAYTYDVMGNRTSSTQLAGTANASTISYTYEPVFDRLASFTDALGNVTTYRYDDTVNQISRTDPLGNQTTILLNSLGAVTSISDPLNETWRYSYLGADKTSITDPSNNASTFDYDGVGRLVSKTNASGQTTTYTYDALNHILTEVDPLGHTTTYGYDANGNAVSVTDPQNSTTPTKIVFDSMDRVQTRTDPLSHSDTYTYDLNGNLTCSTDRNGQITVISYDGINRRTSTLYKASSCSATASSNQLSYSYDAGNRLTGITDSLSGTVTRAYDGLDNLTSDSGPQGSVAYSYDVGRRKTSMTVAGQPSVCYSYDQNSRPTGIGQGSCPEATNIVSMVYDAASRRTSMMLPNGISAQYSYDADSHVTGLTYSNGSQAVGTVTYGYDAVGSRSQVTGSLAQINIPSAITSASYNGNNQVTQWGSATLTYDLDGNLQGDGSSQYTWDARNQLASITGANVASFQYDGLGRRVSKTVNGTSTGLVYADRNVVEELSGTTPTATMLTGLGVDEVYSRTDSTGMHVFIVDGMGNTLALTDPTGAIQTQYTYDPFGNTSTSGTANVNPVQYSGRENDGTGLYYYRARCYSPTLGRFISEDPKGFGGGTNLYRYADDNPATFRDPLGLQDIDPCLALYFADVLSCMDTFIIGPQQQRCLNTAAENLENCRNNQPFRNPNPGEPIDPEDVPPGVDEPPAPDNPGGSGDPGSPGNPGGSGNPGGAGNREPLPPGCFPPFATPCGFPDYSPPGCLTLPCPPQPYDPAPSPGGGSPMGGRKPRHGAGGNW
jgi:RHS repeat-associated protein